MNASRYAENIWAYVSLSATGSWITTAGADAAGPCESGDARTGAAPSLSEACSAPQFAQRLEGGCCQLRIGPNVLVEPRGHSWRPVSTGAAGVRYLVEERPVQCGNAFVQYLLSSLVVARTIGSEIGRIEAFLIDQAQIQKQLHKPASVRVVFT